MADLPPNSEREESTALHRLRVGLTGLACVFLLVLLATAFLRMAGDRGVTGNSVTVAASNSLDTPSEPLAQLGVAPGNAPAETRTPTPTPTPAPAKPHVAH